MKGLDSPRSIAYWVLADNGELAGMVRISEIIRGAA
jgi:hypothetical protein